MREKSNKNGVSPKAKGKILQELCFKTRQAPVEMYRNDFLSRDTQDLKNMSPCQDQPLERGFPTRSWSDLSS